MAIEIKIVTAIFNPDSATANAYGLWQWDYGQVLRIQGLHLPSMVEIHFSLQDTGGTSVMRVGITKDGVTDVVIPDSMLQNNGAASDYDIFAFVYLTDDTSGQTEYKIKLRVKSRPEPEVPSGGEDPDIFHEAVRKVAEYADQAAESEKQAEGWAHGREDLPERAQDNAKYYAGQAAADAKKTGTDRKEVERLVESVSGIDEQVVKVENLTKQAQTSATNAALSEQAAKTAETNAQNAQAGAETAEGNAELAERNAKASEQAVEKAKQLVTQMGQEVLDNKNHVDQTAQAFTLTAQQAVADINNAGQTQTERVEGAGNTAVESVKTAQNTATKAIETAKTEAVEAVQTEGTTQTGNVTAEGTKQVQAVQQAAQEIVADREQIAQNKADVTALKEDLGNVDKIVLNEMMNPTVLTDYGFTFNTVIGRKYTVKIPKTDGYKVATLYVSDAMQQKVVQLTDLTDNRNEKNTEFTATRNSYYIAYQAITPNKEYSVKVVSEVGVFEYVNTNTPKINEVLNINFDDFATKEDVNKGDIFSFTKSVSAIKGNTSNIKGLNLRKEMTYSLEVSADISVYIQLKIVTAFSGNESISHNKGLSLGNAIYVEKGKSVKFENIANNNYVGYSIIANNTDATIIIKTISETETAEAFYVHSKNELINDYYSERPTYACLGDSITSDQVTGIGTVVRKKLGLVDSGNYACGYATCSDWHDEDTNTTVQTMDVPQNTNTNDNVLSNQVRRLLQATTSKGETITWTHPIDGEFSIDASIGVGTGMAETPKIIYIAIGTNDGNNAQNTFTDDSDSVMTQNYSELTRNSYSSALRWAIETLQSAYHNAKIFVASPLQAYSTNLWMSLENTKAKRDCTEKIARFCGVTFIDSFYDSGFSYLTAKADNGGVHPSDTWKENIACFIAGKIESNYWTSKRYLIN